MKMGEAFHLINEFVIFTTTNRDIFKCERCKTLIKVQLDHIAYERLSPREYVLSFHADIPDNRFYLRNNDGFTPVEELMIRNIIDAINKFNAMLSYNELYRVLRSVQLDTLLEAIYREEEGKYVSVLNQQARGLLINHITRMDEWATQTYENRNFAFTLGLDPKAGESSDIHIYDLYDDAMLKVLSSGRYTILVCNQAGEVLRFEKLDQTPRGTSPLLYSGIAQWSKDKVAVSLTLLGEILIFHDRTFLYLRRAGKWYPASRSPLARKMAETAGYNPQMKKALIDTCYDVSFLRCGACIGVVESDCPLIYDSDRYETASTPRAAFFRQTLGKRKFQEIPREIRQELAGIDGAIVIDKAGNIMAIGAILRINTTRVSNRAAGGRSVAARQLAEYGIGIKISVDGSIEAWKKNRNGLLEKFIEVL